MLLRKTPLESDLDLSSVASDCVGMSGAELAGVCREARWPCCGWACRPTKQGLTRIGWRPSCAGLHGSDGGGGEKCDERPFPRGSTFETMIVVRDVVGGNCVQSLMNHVLLVLVLFLLVLVVPFVVVVVVVAVVTIVAVVVVVMTTTSSCFAV